MLRNEFNAFFTTVYTTFSLHFFLIVKVGGV